MIPRNHLLIIGGMLLAAAIASGVMQSRIPDPAPVHWNLHGEVDQMGPRWQVVWLFPAIAVGVAALLAFLPALGPLKSNFEKFRIVYGRMCVFIMLMLLAMHVVIMLSASGANIRIGAAITIVSGFMMMFIGNWLGKVRRNFYLGVRTPWTLANEHVWERTHRNVGPLMMFHGLVSVVTGLFAPDYICFIVFIGGMIAICAWAMVYSFLVYRKIGSVDDMAMSGTSAEL